MFSQIMTVVSWVGIAVFCWSVADSLAKIASALSQPKAHGSSGSQPGAA